MAFRETLKYVCEYKGTSEADAIREWCRGKIERAHGELRLIRGKELIGKGSRQRHLDFERLAGQIDSLEILLETKFIEEDK